MMPRHCLCLLLLSYLRVIHAEEPAVFTPPQAYPASRYEAGWSRNPFTLKTVAPVAAQDSFARGLAIGAHYGAADNPTVVIVNTKTHERFLLRQDKPAPGGMRLKSVHLSSTRQECQVEIMLGAEAAVLTYDSKYLGQLAATEAARMAAPAKKTSVLPPIPLPVLKSAAVPAVITSQTFSPARLRFAAP